MPEAFLLYLIPLGLAIFLAMNMGGSGAVPAFSIAISSTILKKESVPGIFSLFVLAGALVAGRKTTLTISQDILQAESMHIILVSIILLAVCLSLFFANILSIPQSTSQATVCALVGAGLYLNNLTPERLYTEIIPAWVILPIISFLAIYISGRFIYHSNRRNRFKNLFVKYDFIRNHGMIKVALMIGAFFIAFAIGSNNVANAVGPIFSLVCNTIQISSTSDNYYLAITLCTLIIAPFFGTGFSFFKQTPEEFFHGNLLNYGPLGGIVISFVSATLLLTASLTNGIPVSLVQIYIAGELGLSVSKSGWRFTFSKKDNGLKWLVWLLVPISCLLLSFLFTMMADSFGLLYL